MENENQNLIAALEYADSGWSVIPIGKDKKTLIKWESYQHTRATKEEIKAWFTRYPDANVGIVTGAISGIVVIDIDTPEKIDYPLPLTVVSQTASGGRHIFCKHPGQEVKNRVRIVPNVDIRADGGYVVVPPSLLASGNQYVWSIPPGDVELAELPQWVFETDKDTKHTDWRAITENEISDGSRNQTTARVVGKMLGILPEDTWKMAWLAMKQLNQENSVPPLPEKELKTVFNSIANRELKKRTENKGLNASYKIETITLAELVKTEYKNTQWLVDRLIPHEAVTIISGAPASYKTFITLDIALKIAGGEKLFGEFQTRQSAVLIIDEENHPRIIKKRVGLLLKNAELPIYVSSKKGFLLGKDSVEKIIECAKSKNVELVIFDSLNCIHDAEENSATEMRGVMKHLKEIANHGIAVIVIHHHGKKKNERTNASQDIRGSSDILAQVDCHLAVDRKGKDESVIVQQNKLREAQEMQPFVIHFRGNDDNRHFEYGGHSKGKPGKKEEVKIAIKKVLDEAGKPLIKKELWGLVQKMGIKTGHSTFKAAVEEMIIDSQLFTRKGDKSSVFCSLKSLGADDG